MSLTAWPVLRSYQSPIERLGHDPELNDQVCGQVLGLDLAALFPPEAEQGGLVVAHDDPGVGAADEIAAFILSACPILRIHVFLHGENDVACYATKKRLCYFS